MRHIKKRTGNGPAALRVTVMSFTLLSAAASPAQDWVQTSAPSALWSGVACSADGSRVVAAARFASRNYEPSGVYVSTNSGKTWTLTTAPIQYWGKVAASSDGLKLAAIGNENPTPTPNGGIYLSADGGASWTLSSAPRTNWSEVSCSGDGTRLVADVWDGLIYASTNSGATWTIADAPTLYWQGLAASADGRKLVAAGGEYLHPSVRHVYVSANFGFTWTEVSAPSSLREFASSADGSRLAGLGATIYCSKDAGQTWKAVLPASSQEWLAVASSADGAKLVAAGMGAGTSDYFPTPVFASTDSGQTWQQLGTIQGYWNALACSSDGAKVVVAQGGLNAGFIYTWQTPPHLTIAAVGGGLLLSWPRSATGFALQQSPDPPSGAWMDVTNTAQVVGDQKQVVISNSGPKSFYRLQSP